MVNRLPVVIAWGIKLCKHVSGDRGCVKEARETLLQRCLGAQLSPEPTEGLHLLEMPNPKSLFIRL